MNPFVAHFIRTCCALLLGVCGVSCSIKPEHFGKSDLDQSFLRYQNSQATAWVAYRDEDLLPGHADRREVVLNDDPSRGIGLKQSAGMGGGDAPFPGKSHFRVFLFMGQSNMVGHAKAGRLVPPFSKPHPRIRIWSKGRWQYLVPKHNFGPDVSFAHKAVEYFPNDTIGIIKVAVSGTGMNAWKPDWEWSEASKTGDALKGSLYRDMINAVSAAVAVSDFQLSGFVWKQGGRDGRKTELAETYQERFVELVSHVRSDLGAPELPVFVLTYFDEDGIEAHRHILEKVRPKAMPLYLSKAKVSDYLSNAFPIFHGRLPTGLDQVHFNKEGQIRLGEMTADAIAKYYTIHEPVIGVRQRKSRGKVKSPPLPK